MKYLQIYENFDHTEDKYFGEPKEQELKDNGTFLKYLEDTNFKEVEIDTVGDSLVKIYPYVDKGENTRNNHGYIYFSAKDGKLFIQGVFAHRVGQFQKWFSNTSTSNVGIAGMTYLSIGEREGEEINPEDLDVYVHAVVQSLRSESQAQRDFYKNWKNPD